LCVDAHHLAIVSAICSGTNFQAQPIMATIGACETLLAVGILSGLFYRFVSIFQIAIVIAMNLVGIICGGGNIQNPVGLIVTNLPLIMCALAIALYGPGEFSIKLGQSV
jgi:uncharacterized membrane protein YphA (DoxX/SURF4 family)